jgi:hypothetical protein
MDARPIDAANARLLGTAWAKVARESASAVLTKVLSIAQVIFYRMTLPLLKAFILLFQVFPIHHNSIFFRMLLLFNRTKIQQKKHKTTLAPQKLKTGN